MNRYQVFAGTNYYPSGGWDDRIGGADSIEEGLKLLLGTKYGYDWWQIIDLETGRRMVKS